VEQLLHHLRHQQRVVLQQLRHYPDQEHGRGD
jgi:Mg/Co/Ni transporter MgtE